MNRTIVSVVLLVACSTAPRPTPTSAHASALSSTCAPVPFDPAITDYRAAIQDACTCGRVELGAGTYPIVTPDQPRTIALLKMPFGGCEIIGAGPDRTTLAFTGHTGATQQDWRGIQLAAGGWVHGLTADSSGLVVDVPNEQTHIMRLDGDGSTTPTTIDNFNCVHNGGGDCIQFVGYAPVPPASVDRRIWHVKVHDVVAASSRSVIAVHSGLNDFEFYNITGRAKDQVFDFEGSGDTFDGDIHDNTALLADGQQSSIFADLNSLTRLHFHHNTSASLGIQIYYCWSCEFDHNTITQAFPNNAATVSIIAADGVWFHDEVYTRNADMINGPVFSAVQHGSVPPHNIRITDSKLVQHMSWTGANLVGVTGVDFDHLLYVYDGIGPARIAINAESSKGTYATVTRDVNIKHSRLVSTTTPFYAGVTVGAGVGSVTVTDTTTTNATRGMTCGAGTGPVAFARNAWAEPTTCRGP